MYTVVLNIGIGIMSAAIFAVYKEFRQFRNERSNEQMIQNIIDVSIIAAMNSNVPQPDILLDVVMNPQLIFKDCKIA